ncbi:MAG TPA: hypothetical protein VF699_14275 [Caulobacteraceae bacterium]|jgi:hypothetical protein
MTVLYPVAASADEALAAPRARAAREREAAAAAAASVRFVSELAGPAFTSREAALAAYAGRVEDARPIPPEDRWCELVEIAAPSTPPPVPVKPTLAGGRRWPAPPPAAPTVWRLRVSYWRLGEPEAEVPQDQARRLRRAEQAAALQPAAVRALSRQPLRPVRPQQPLDIGLFETRPPEAPHIVMPDE